MCSQAQQQELSREKSLVTRRWGEYHAGQKSCDRIQCDTIVALLQVLAQTNIRLLVAQLTAVP